jgi:hypothetical protein
LYNKCGNMHGATSKIVMFVFESEEEGTDSKSTNSSLLGFRNGKCEALCESHKAALYCNVIFLLAVCLFIVKVYRSYRRCVTCSFSDTLSTAKLYGSLNEIVAQPKNRPFGANITVGLKNVTAASDNNDI